MITKELLAESYHAGIVKLIPDPNLGKGTVCGIGDCWFYFGGLTAEEYTPDEYRADVPEDDILAEIYVTLNDLYVDFPDEYDYYSAFLTEWKGRFNTEYAQELKERKALLQSIPNETLVAELLRRRAKVDNSSVHLILENSGYLEWKLWDSDDIMGVLKNKGYAKSEENLSAVINTGYLKALRDCSDDDWYAVGNAIWEANRRSPLTPLSPEDKEEGETDA